MRNTVLTVLILGSVFGCKTARKSSDTSDVKFIVSDNNQPAASANKTSCSEGRPQTCNIWLYFYDNRKGAQATTFEYREVTLTSTQRPAVCGAAECRALAKVYMAREVQDTRISDRYNFRTEAVQWIYNDSVINDSDGLECRTDLTPDQKKQIEGTAGVSCGKVQ